MSETILEIKGVNRTYKDEDTVVNVLSDVNLSVNRGELVSIIGLSGCG